MAIDFDNPRERAVFFDLYEGLPRGGPGNRESTTRALGLIESLPASPRILDLGCGPGAQTIALAEALPEADITAVDLHRPFLESLDQELGRRGLHGRVRACCADMAQLDVPPGSIDLIWSEGAAYFMGVGNALASWRPLLAPRGALAITEATWFRSDPPEEVRRCWADEYPDIRDVDTCLPLFSDNGYQLLGHFPLPEQAWWDDFYTPMEARIEVLRSTYSGDALAEQVLDECQREVELYRRYNAYYGYTFFIAGITPDG